MRQPTIIMKQTDTGTIWLFYDPVRHGWRFELSGFVEQHPLRTVRVLGNTGPSGPVNDRPAMGPVGPINMVPDGPMLLPLVPVVSNGEDLARKLKAHEKRILDYLMDHRKPPRCRQKNGKR